MKRLKFDLEGKLVDANTGDVVKAKAVSASPQMVGVHVSWSSDCFDQDAIKEEYSKQLDRGAVDCAKEVQRLQFEADAYVDGFGVDSDFRTHQKHEKSLWVPIQLYKLEE